MLTVNEILKATNGQLMIGDRGFVVSGFSIDSRNIKARQAFIAIKGQRLDGHAFIKKVLESSSQIIIASSKKVLPQAKIWIYVKDTTKALGQIAKAHRDKFDIDVIAITGSAGKTTTKDLLAKVLAKKYCVLKNARSENNHIGLPLTLLKLKKKHQKVVLELGTNQPGDIRYLAQIARPTVAIFTNIGEAHLQGLKSKNGIFKEKTSLIKHLDKSACVIFNADDPFLAKIPKRFADIRYLTYGVENKSDIKGKNIRIVKKKVCFSVKKQEFILKTPAIHQIYNALCAICCSQQFAISYNDIKDSLGRFQFKNGRFECKTYGKVTVFDDTYNANPLSYKAAILTLDKYETKRTKVAVCADMMELGKQAVGLHKDLGRYIEGSSVDVVLSFGKLSKNITRTTLSDTAKKSFHFSSKARLHQKLKQLCKDGAVVLVKGSRSMKMEQTVSFLNKQFSSAYAGHHGFTRGTR